MIIPLKMYMNIFLYSTKEGIYNFGDNFQNKEVYFRKYYEVKGSSGFLSGGILSMSRLKTEIVCMVNTARILQKLNEAELIDLGIMILRLAKRWLP